MAPVEILGIPGQHLAHDRGDALSAALEEDMNVIIHQHPGIDGAFALLDRLPQPLEKTSPVLLVSKYPGAIAPPHHDMVQGAECV